MTNKHETEEQDKSPCIDCSFRALEDGKDYCAYTGEYINANVSCRLYHKFGVNDKIPKDYRPEIIEVTGTNNEPEQEALETVAEQLFSMICEYRKDMYFSTWAANPIIHSAWYPAARSILQTLYDLGYRSPEEVKDWGLVSS